MLEDEILDELNTQLEYAAIVIDRQIKLIAMYNNNGTKLRDNKLLDLMNSYNKVIVMGYLNTKHPAWGLNTLMLQAEKFEK